MADGKSGPSKWWFWVFPVLVNAYLLLVAVLELVAWRFALRRGEPAASIITGFELPAKLVFEDLAVGLWVEWKGIRGLFLMPPHLYLVGLVLWEVGAALLGLLGYGSALLVCSIVAESSEREDRRNGSGE